MRLEAAPMQSKIFGASVLPRSALYSEVEPVRLTPVDFTSSNNRNRVWKWFL